MTLCYWMIQCMENINGRIPFCFQSLYTFLKWCKIRGFFNRNDYKNMESLKCTDKKQKRHLANQTNAKCLFYYDRLSFNNKYKKYGAPMMAVMIPAGIPSGSTRFRPIVSESNNSHPPIRMTMGM